MQLNVFFFSSIFFFKWNTKTWGQNFENGQRKDRNNASHSCWKTIYLVLCNLLLQATIEIHLMFVFTLRSQYFRRNTHTHTHTVLFDCTVAHIVYIRKTLPVRCTFFSLYIFPFHMLCHSFWHISVSCIQYECTRNVDTRENRRRQSRFSIDLSIFISVLQSITI